MGFEVNPDEPYVWNKMVKGKQMTVVLYVDDLKVSFCEEDGNGELDVFLSDLSNVYGKLESNRDGVFDYCGINIDYGTRGVCKLSTTKYTETAAEDFEAVHGKIRKGAKTPAQNNLFAQGRKKKGLSFGFCETFIGGC